MRWTLLMVAVVAGLASLPGVTPGMRLTDGELVLQNSLDGQPLFTADNVAPGESTSGAVTLTNAGSLTGSLALEASQIADSGGPLSAQLRLRVEDLSSGTTAYDGPLAGMGSLSLGTLAPGAARVYRLTASLPASATAAVAGSQTTVSYRWTATDAPTPPPPRPPVQPPKPPPGGTPDLREPLRLRVRVPARQPLWGRGKLVAFVRCDQTCWLRARARVTVGGRTALTRWTRSSRTGARREKRLVLTLPRKRAKAVAASAPGTRRGAVHLTVWARAHAGATRTARKRARIALPAQRPAAPRRVIPQSGACGARATGGGEGAHAAC
jgi:hypothetical protein